jgi:competence protein ComGC
LGVYLSKKSKFHQIKANGFIKNQQIRSKKGKKGQIKANFSK